MSYREALIAKALKQGCGVEGQPLPAVSLEDFFVENDDLGSIGCNLEPHPGIPRFYQPLLSIRDRESVQDVLVEINEIEVSDQGMWPFSERVYFLTRASKAEVATWMEELEPDSIAEGYMFGIPAAAPELLPGMRVLNAWWD